MTHHLAFNRNKIVLNLIEKSSVLGIERRQFAGSRLMLNRLGKSDLCIFDFASLAE
jgi:hypothetical protein